MDDQAEVIRSMIRHEDDLANHRASWLNGGQGLLFTGMTFAWRETQGHSYLVTLFAVLGISVALLSLVALGSATFAVKNLLVWWEEHKGDYSGPPVVGVYPSSKMAYLSPRNALPLVYVAAWVSVLIMRG